MERDDLDSLSKGERASAIYRDVMLRVKDAQDSVVKAGCVEDLNKALKDLAALRVWVTEVHDDIPARDQNTYHSALEQLNTQIINRRATFQKARGKFSFKRTGGLQTAASPAQSTQRESIPESSRLPMETSTVRNTSRRTWENKRGQELRPSDPIFAATQGDLHLRHLDSCLVDLRPHTQAQANKLQAVFVQEARCSILLIGTIEGSVMLRDCHDILIVGQCRQYRMHDSTRSICLLSSPSAITLEGCRQLQIGSCPPQGLVDSLHTDGIPQHRPVNVQDFDHVSHLTLSPNWSECPDGASILKVALNVWEHQKLVSLEVWDTELKSGKE